MNNYLSVVVALLENLGLLAEEEASKLAKELASATLPDTYDGAAALMRRVFEDHNVKDIGQLPAVKQFKADLHSMKRELDTKASLADLAIHQVSDTLAEKTPDSLGHPSEAAADVS